MKIKNELLRDIVYGGSRAAAAVALGGAVCWAAYELDQKVADDHASRVESCAEHTTEDAIGRCITDADALRVTAGIAEVAVFFAAAGTAIGVTIHGARQVFGYSE